MARAGDRLRDHGRHQRGHSVRRPVASAHPLPASLSGGRNRAWRRRDRGRLSPLLLRDEHPRRGSRGRRHIRRAGDRGVLGCAAPARDRERHDHRRDAGHPRGHSPGQPASHAAPAGRGRSRLGRGLTDFLEEHAEQVGRAAARIKGHVRRTPAMTTDLDPALRLKPECFQVTGSFKPRGAFNAILSLVARGARPPGVIAVSSGNHAQAVALAASSVGVSALILIPEDANPAKVAATRALGAEVIQEGITFANREQRLREVMAERGYVLVHPFDDWDVIHGQGTVARELLEDGPDLEVVAAPLGGGGLLSGTAIAAKRHRPSLKVVGVEAAAADDGYRPWRSGSIQTLTSSPSTLADGVRTTAIGKRNFEVMFEHGLVDEVVTVTEEEIAAAVKVAWSRLHLALEPTGALPLAAHVAGKLTEGRRTGLILSGGNANLQTVATLLK